MRPRANEASSAASGGVSAVDAAHDLCLAESHPRHLPQSRCRLQAAQSTPPETASSADTRRLSAPPIWLAAWRACVSVCASIRSRTASACVRSSLPAKKARCVNSPGSASRAPKSQRPAQQKLQHHRRTVRRNLHQIFCGVGIGPGKPRHHGLVDAFASGVRLRPAHRPAAPARAPAAGAGSQAERRWTPPPARSAARCRCPRGLAAWRWRAIVSAPVEDSVMA